MCDADWQQLFTKQTHHWLAILYSTSLSVSPLSTVQWTALKSQERVPFSLWPWQSLPFSRNIFQWSADHTSVIPRLHIDAAIQRGLVRIKICSSRSHSWHHWACTFTQRSTCLTVAPAGCEKCGYLRRYCQSPPSLHAHCVWANPC